jgi:hypothetical protein
VGNDVVVTEAGIDDGFENRDALLRDLGPPHAPDQLFRFAAKHATDNDFYPPGILGGIMDRGDRHLFFRW